MIKIVLILLTTTVLLLSLLLNTSTVVADDCWWNTTPVHYGEQASVMVRTSLQSFNIYIDGGLDIIDMNAYTITDGFTGTEPLPATMTHQGGGNYYIDIDYVHEEYFVMIDLQTTMPGDMYVSWCGETRYIRVFRLYKDANGDGHINSADITYVERIAVGLEEHTFNADVNEDGDINTADVTGLEILLTTWIDLT